ncbi:hypothetical protein M378DRAFT_854996 [Amanita muscaria Koide BX008]|uniref:Uncharacterized protein n=1 Tax=Amanita muscaria (strain Koide BX008) TaxID=946122 RepID=A0A0C2T4F9_AMAMK|nr:hypothetical protein M378DRAFT_854996 [Amanita muscaria Koide BX008]
MASTKIWHPTYISVVLPDSSQQLCCQNYDIHQHSIIRPSRAITTSRQFALLASWILIITISDFFSQC